MTHPSQIIDVFKAVLAEQGEHEAMPAIELAEPVLLPGGLVKIRLGRHEETVTLQDAYQKVVWRNKWIEDSEADHYTHGMRFPEWDNILWEIARLRVANPGEPIEFGLFGANGSAKTYFAAWLMMEAMVQCPVKGPDWAHMFWTLALDEQASETVPQKALYYWLPNDYKTTTGAVRTDAKQKLRFNPTGGFTDNQYSLKNGAQMQGRFWSKDIKTLEGVRPIMCWSDEGVPVPWLEGATNRLVTSATRTKVYAPKFDIMLRQKEQNPEMPFPRDMIYPLIHALHLVTYTFRDGFTETVQAFDGVAVKQIEADPELLPRRDKDGNIIGGEKMPKIYKCNNPTRAAYWIHAWDNPIGGNWEGLRKRALKMKRPGRLWIAYGVAERKSGTPFPNFDERLHVIPTHWMPRRSVLINTVDSLVAGTRAWAKLWALRSLEYHRCFAPGDLIVVHEWPQTDDVIPGYGPGEVWAEPGGKNGVGVKGPAQTREWRIGFKFRAEEIRRVETKLCKELQWRIPTLADGEEWNEANQWPLIDYGLRMMDSRMGNTELADESDTHTVIDMMLAQGLEFIRWGRDSGASQGTTKVMAGEQMIDDLFYFDADLAVLDEKSGRLAIDPAKAPGPRLWILSRCTNLIDAIKHYPGSAMGDSPYKDFIDCLRAMVIADLDGIGRPTKVRGGTQ